MPTIGTVIIHHVNLIVCHFVIEFVYSNDFVSKYKNHVFFLHIYYKSSSKWKLFMSSPNHNLEFASLANNYEEDYLKTLEFDSIIIQ